MRRAKRKRSNRLKRKHLDKLARAKLARWSRVFTDAYKNAAVTIDKKYWPGKSSFSYAITMSAGGSGGAGGSIQPIGDPYIPPPELAAIRIHIQALIKAEKKRIRQEYLTTRTGKEMQDV